MMTKCSKCRVEVSNEDLYEDQGLKLCEDCKMKTTQSPPESCATTKNMIK